MLVDLPAAWRPHPDLARMTPGRIYRGVYLGHLNWHTGLNPEHHRHDLRPLIKAEYPFTDALRAHFERQRAARDADPHHVPDPWPVHLPDDIGTCDHWTQILARWPELAANPDHHYLITLSVVVKASEPATGGWRWHKNGTYIGIFDRQCEYLYDEPEVQEVWCFHIHELHPPTSPVWWQWLDDAAIDRQRVPAKDPHGSPPGSGERARIAAEKLPTVGQWPGPHTEAEVRADRGA